MFASLLDLRTILAAVAGAALMFVVWTIYQPFHDAGVTREARREYVAISELEAQRAKANTTAQLLEAEQKKTAQIQAVLDATAKAVEVTITEIREANEAAQEEMQNEIDDLISARPDVPSVRDLGVKLRN